MAITAIVSVMAYAGLDNAIKLAETSEVATDRLHKINRVFDIISKDFHQVIARPVRNPEGSDIEASLMLDATSQPVLKFSRAGWINPQAERFQRSELQRVNYYFEGTKFIRYSWQMMDRYQDSVPQEIVLLDDVRSLNIRVLSEVGTIKNNQVAAADKGEWLTSWPIATPLSTIKPGASLPIAIEIVVDIESIGLVRRVFELPTGVSSW
jgi:general secretion pathway protein J